MNGIRAMVASDFLRSRSYLMQLLWVWGLLGIVINLLQDAPLFALIAVPAGTGFATLISAFVQDETGDWQVFRLTTPVSRRSVVWGRVVSVSLMVLVSAVYAVVLAVVSMGIGQAMGMEGLNFGGLYMSDWEVIGGALLLTVGGTLIGDAVMLPLAFKNGMQTTIRYAPLVLALGVSLVSYLLSEAGPWGDLPLQVFERLMAGVGGILGFGGLVLAAGVVVWLLCGAFSVRLYEARQF